MDDPWWTYRAELDRVVDGDTVDFHVDLGFRVHMNVRLRLAGIDTAEIYGVSHDSDEYERGLDHKSFVEDWFDDHRGPFEWPFEITTAKDTGKYGRWPGRVVSRDDGAVLVLDLIDAHPDVAD